MRKILSPFLKKYHDVKRSKKQLPDAELKQFIVVAPEINKRCSLFDVARLLKV
jgi:hypothetical protein